MAGTHNVVVVLIRLDPGMGDCQTPGCLRDAEFTVATRSGHELMPPICAPCLLAKVNA